MFLRHTHTHTQFWNQIAKYTEINYCLKVLEHAWMGQVYKPSNSTVCMEIVFFILYSTMIYQNHIKHTQLDIKVIYQVPVKSVQSFTFLTSLLIPNSFIQSETFIKALSFFKKAACLLQGLHRNLFKWRHIKDYIKKH